jgi:DNA-binding MarR family transcriptional regulator
MLAAINEHPHPAELADILCMPKPTVTVYLKRLGEADFVRRETDPADLRRHRLTVTPAGRKVMTRGTRRARVSSAGVIGRAPTSMTHLTTPPPFVCASAHIT